MVSYDNIVGMFTVPPGGDGVYYFSTYVLVSPGEGARFDMRPNDVVICSTYPDQSESAETDVAPGSCILDAVGGNIFLIFVAVYNNADQ